MDPVWQPKVDKAFADTAAKRFGELPVDPIHAELERKRAAEEKAKEAAKHAQEDGAKAGN
jgi:hypothetical protein